MWYMIGMIRYMSNMMWYDIIDMVWYMIYNWYMVYMIIDMIYDWYGIYDWYNMMWYMIWLIWYIYVCVCVCDIYFMQFVFHQVAVGSKRVQK